MCAELSPFITIIVLVLILKKAGHISPAFQF